MRNSKKNFRDIELLSAYLDNELQPEERAQLETRLAQDAGLRQLLKDLDNTRTVLRSAPQVRRPRSFVLTEDMVRQQRFAFRAMRFSRMVATAATVLFAFVFAGQMFFARSFGMSAANMESDAITMQDDSIAEDMAFPADEDGMMQAAPMTAEMEEAAEADMADGEVMTEEAVEEALPADMMENGPAGGGGVMGTMESPVAGDDAAENTADAEVAAEGDAPDTEDTGAETQTPEPTVAPRAADMNKSTPTEALEEPAEEATMFMALPTDMVGGIEDSDTTAVDEAQEPIVEPWWHGISTTVFVQAGLLVVAVLAAISWVYFRRRLK